MERLLSHHACCGEQEDFNPCLETSKIYEHTSYMCPTFALRCSKTCAWFHISQCIICVSILITLARAALMLTALGLIISSNRGDGPDMSQDGSIDP